MKQAGSTGTGSEFSGSLLLHAVVQTAQGSNPNSTTYYLCLLWAFFSYSGLNYIPLPPILYHGTKSQYLKMSSDLETKWSHM